MGGVLLRIQHGNGKEAYVICAAFEVMIGFALLDARLGRLVEGGLSPRGLIAATS